VREIGWVGWGVYEPQNLTTTTKQPKEKQNDSFPVLSYLSALVENRIDATNQGRKEKGRRGKKEKRRNDQKSPHHLLVRQFSLCCFCLACII